MNNFNDEKIDKMLKAYCTREDETFTFTKPKKVKHSALIAACLVLVILAGIIFIPNLIPHKEHSFIIVANAQTLDEEGIASADEINHDFFVKCAEIRSSNQIDFDFDEILYTGATEYDLVKRYLFHSIQTRLDLSVQGENISKVTYEVSKGGLGLLYYGGDRADLNDPEIAKSIRNSWYFAYEAAKTKQTIKYKDQEIATIGYSSVFDPNVKYESINKYFSSPDPVAMQHHYYLETDEYIYSENYDELKQYGRVEMLGYGYRTPTPTDVTEEEKKILTEYAAADDMRGFFNYQNEIFKRILEDVEIYVTATFTDGTKQTKTLELQYTPDYITEQDWNNDHWYLHNQWNSYSRGDICARLK